MKIDFVIVGAQKAGTTALFEYLQKHPSIIMPKSKELHFFDNDSNFNHKEHDYRHYNNQFCPATLSKIRGEATPIYMYWVTAMRRIWLYNPNIKIIVLLRNPIARAFSHWQMEINRHQDNASFFYAISHEKQRCKSVFPEQHRVYSYIDRGLYSIQLKRIWELFPRNQVLVIQSENLKNNPEKILREICQHLCIDADFYQSVEPLYSFSGEYIQKIDAKSFSLLQSKFENDIKQLEVLLGWNLSEWLN